MKILLIFDENKKDAAAQARSLLDEMGISAETLALKPQEDRDIKKQFSFFFDITGFEEADKVSKDSPTHVCVLSPLAERWIDFFAGYSCGSRLPFLVYGEEAIEAVPVEFISFFRTFKTESALRDFLRSEYEAFNKWKAANEVIKARETLLAMGVPVNGEALANCVGEGGIREVSLFFAAGFSPDTRNKAGVPLLNIAARKGNWEILRLLLQTGAQVNLQADDRGTSALIDSILCKQYDIAGDLVKAGADVNIQSKDGQTALVVAVGAGEAQVTEMLVKAGANPDIADSMGMSARQYAGLFHRDAIESIFNTLSPPKAE